MYLMLISLTWQTADPFKEVSVGGDTSANYYHDIPTLTPP